MTPDTPPTVTPTPPPSSGEYRAQAGLLEVRMQSVYGDREWSGAKAGASMRRTGGLTSAAVLIFRASEDFSWSAATGSAYLIGTDATQYYYVGVYVNGSFSFLQSWTYSANLNYGELGNQIEAEFAGSNLVVRFKRKRDVVRNGQFDSGRRAHRIDGL